MLPPRWTFGDREADPSVPSAVESGLRPPSDHRIRALSEPHEAPACAARDEPRQLHFAQQHGEAVGRHRARVR